MDEHQNDDIRHEVGQRVDGISHHRSTMAQDARYELEEQQYHVYCPSDKRHLIYLFIPFHCHKCCS